MQLLEGSLQMEIEKQPSFTMRIGDLNVVTKGAKHKVSSDKECTLLLIESRTTLHTGNLIIEITKSVKEQQV